MGIRQSMHGLILHNVHYIKFCETRNVVVYYRHAPWQQTGNHHSLLVLLQWVALWTTVQSVSLPGHTGSLASFPGLHPSYCRITCETLPGLLCAFRTASDKSWGGGLGTRLQAAWEQETSETDNRYLQGTAATKLAKHAL